MERFHTNQDSDEYLEKQHEGFQSVSNNGFDDMPASHNQSTENNMDTKNNKTKNGYNQNHQISALTEQNEDDYEDELTISYGAYLGGVGTKRQKGEKKKVTTVHE